MERIEKVLKNQMKGSNHASYPDFDKMWNSIQQNEMLILDSEPAAQRTRKRKRTAIIAGLSVALMATPVYAAIQYDWSGILSYKSGIKSALEQGLGQTLNQSITKNGATLTLHTAFTDENRTFLLYSLDPGAEQEGKYVRFDNMGLIDHKGTLIEGNYSHLWNEELGVFQGFFETDWVMDGNQADMEFTVENLIFIGDGKQTIHFNSDDAKTQEIQIHKDGIESVKLQSFEQVDGKVMLQSAVTFTDPEQQASRWIRIQALNDKEEPIKEAETPVIGTPGGKNEFISQQVFESGQLRAKGTTFQITYERTSGITEGPWNINLALSKKQLENGSFKENLNIPLDQVAAGTKISQMIVTPTQVRLILTHKEKYSRVPYKNYQLDAGGKLLDGGIQYGTGKPGQTELRFEVSGLEVSELANKPLSLVASYRIDEHKGSSDPIRLTDISEKRQTISTSIGEFPITWAYYMKDNNLYVESSSTNPAFGGVNQTYYLKGNDPEYGKPVMVGFQGDGNNKQIDVYKNFDKSELEIYTWRYTTEKPNDELRVPLKEGK
ncbi:DUF4179 domain-containing protein [Paenibacillus dakarensis]|uniref:DUF4179 domain-containing protein n=1 Tax=Paenibacillus dakarensis TaxID=1527293 RepID=UPI0006D55922|nr:DUF4179 domain-containing protein [Paenibacillus dakarensis]